MSQDLHSDFLRLHLPHQRALFAYLLGAVQDFQKAEDLLQEVTLVLWKKFAEYREGSPFLPWALGVARNEILHHFRDRKRDFGLLPIETLDLVAETLSGEEKSLAAEAGALLDCVKKLPESDRDLLKLRYQGEVSLGELARRVGPSLAAINMRLVRIRRALLECTGRLLEGGA